MPSEYNLQETVLQSIYCVLSLFADEALHLWLQHQIEHPGSKGRPEQCPIQRFHHNLSVCLSDPLAVTIFNMITCLFAESALQSKSEVSLPFQSESLQLLLFADDAVVVANSVKNLLILCNETNAFLHWSKIEPNKSTTVTSSRNNSIPTSYKYTSQ